jgi:hypothetical protein
MPTLMNKENGTLSTNTIPVHKPSVIVKRPQTSVAANKTIRKDLIFRNKGLKQAKGNLLDNLTNVPKP